MAFVSETALSMPPSDSAAGMRSPLSGPTRRALRGWQGERAPLGAHAGVYDGEVDRILGHVACGVLQDLRPLLYREAGHLVGQVDHLGLRQDPEHHPLAQPDEVVAETEVREKADRPHAVRGYHEPKPVVSSGNCRAPARVGSG